MSFRKELQRKFAVAKKKYLKEYPNCELCLLLGKLTPAIDVHHRVHRWNPDMYLDEKNFVAVCRIHHQRLEEGREYEQKLLEKVISRRMEKG